MKRDTLTKPSGERGGQRLIKTMNRSQENTQLTVGEAWRGREQASSRSDTKAKHQSRAGRSPRKGSQDPNNLIGKHASLWS